MKALSSVFVTDEAHRVLRLFQESEFLKNATDLEKCPVYVDMDGRLTPNPPYRGALGVWGWKITFQFVQIVAALEALGFYSVEAKKADARIGFLS